MMNHKKSFILLVFVVLTTLTLGANLVTAQSGDSADNLQAALGPGFTYQGYLAEDSGSPMEGACDFRFTLWDDSTAGTQLGTESLTTGVNVSKGYFTVMVNSQGEFGTSAFTGEARWLEVGVSCPAGGGGYTTLTPRQALTPAPLALALSGLYTQPNTISPNVIGGYSGNSVAAGMIGAVIDGGGLSGSINQVTNEFGTVGGGYGNTASGLSATVGGGAENTASDFYATVGGGESNIASGSYAAVGGGESNTASNQYATVGGGSGNIASGSDSTVGGGTDNIANGSDSTVGGGSTNIASGWGATVGGGIVNTAIGSATTVGGGNGNTASGFSATVGGGYGNTASGYYSTVGGGLSNTAAGDYSFVAGNRAMNTDPSHEGVFIFADSLFFDFISTAANQFRVRSTGGVQFVTGIDAAGAPTAGVQVWTGGGSWSSVSDRNLKANFSAVDGRGVLDAVANLPIQTWNYTAQDESIRHIGPTAQDFYAAFNLGEDDRHIATIDADGVALAAIQGLNEIVAEKEAQISSLETRLSALEQGSGSASPLSTPWPWLALVALGGMAFFRRRASR